MGSAGSTALLLAGVVVCAVAGVGLVVGGETAPIRGFGVLVLVLATGGGLTRLALSTAGRGTSAVTVRDGSGRAATRVPGSAALVVLPMVALAAIAIACAAATVTLVDSGDVVLALPLALLGLLALASLAGPLLHGELVDRVDLTVAGVESLHFGARQQISWDDLEGAAAPPGPRGVVPLVLVHGGSPRQLASGWRLWRRVGPPEGMEGRFAVIATRNLRVDASLLAAVLTRLAQDPGARAQLGMEAANDLRSLAGDTRPLY